MKLLRTFRKLLKEDTTEIPMFLSDMFSKTQLDDELNNSFKEVIEYHNWQDKTEEDRNNLVLSVLVDNLQPVLMNSNQDVPYGELFEYLKSTYYTKIDKMFKAYDRMYKVLNAIIEMTYVIPKTNEIVLFNSVTNQPIFKYLKNKKTIVIPKGRFNNHLDLYFNTEELKNYVIKKIFKHFVKTPSPITKIEYS